VLLSLRPPRRCRLRSRGTRPGTTSRPISDTTRTTTQHDTTRHTT
jgi:hypothetical protein